MSWSRAAPIAVAVGVALLGLSGGFAADPRTPAALPGMPAPFLGTAVLGDGGLTGAVDAYGDVVDLRAPGPVGRALVDNPHARQVAGSVPADTGIVPRVRIGGGPALPMWRADSVSQGYVRGTNVLRTVARFGRVEVAITDATVGRELAAIVRAAAPPGTPARPALGLDVVGGRGIACEQIQRGGRVVLVCSASHPETLGPARTRGNDRAGVDRRAAQGTMDASARRLIHAAAAADRRWLALARPLNSAAPRWARALYRRSLLTLRALSDRRSGAVAAGARDGWAYAWPRDAATTALAFASAGYRHEARRIARFLLRLDLGAAARFDGRGEPVPGRGPEGDACGWVEAAARTVARTSSREPGRRHRRSSFVGICPTKDERRPDYQEGEAGDYLANAIASSMGVSEFDPDIRRGSSDTPRGRGPDGTRSDPLRRFERPAGLVRLGGDSASGLDSAAAWAVRPFPHPALYPLVLRTLHQIVGGSGRYGILPSEDWSGGPDPWTAPTAWTAWSLATLGERRQALRLLAELRRAATPAGELPERVGAATGIPRSTTPLAWSHAFAILALRQLWPPRPGGF